MSIYDLSTNQVLLILLALWSIGFWILAVDYMKGGDPLLLHNCILAAKKDLRLASLADFGRFKVSSKGYEDNPRYVFKRERQ